MKKSYSEKLRDPRWQKKRLEVLEAANWTCEECGCKTKELHVHHIWYQQGKAPWEYPVEALAVLCATCHIKVAEAQLRLSEMLGHRCKKVMGGNYIGEIENLIALLEYAGVHPMDTRTGMAAASLLGEAHDCFVIEPLRKAAMAKELRDSEGRI